MSARHSIRLRLVGWLERIRDQLAENTMQPLGGGKVHPQAAVDVCLRCGASINYGLDEGQEHRAVKVARLAQHIDALNGSIVAGNHPSLAAYLDGLATPNNDLINHQNSSYGKNYLASVNLNPAGVEG